MGEKSCQVLTKVKLFQDATFFIINFNQEPE